MNTRYRERFCLLEDLGIGSARLTSYPAPAYATKIASDEPVTAFAVVDFFDPVDRKQASPLA